MSVRASPEVISFRASLFLLLSLAQGGRGTSPRSLSRDQSVPGRSDLRQCALPDLGVILWPAAPGVHGALRALQCCLLSLLQVNLVLGDGRSLGLTIRGGAEYGLGIYVTGVDPGSEAESSGLKVRGP